ncbi:MAG: sigma-70 family RNA polymerase sigma factor [Holophagaceae bacterium]
MTAPTDAFLAQIEPHRGILFKVAGAYTRDPEDLRDLVQDILVQVWRAYPRFDGRCKFSTWMYRIALNVAISFSRAEHARTARLAREEGLLEALPAAPDPGPPGDELALLHRFIDGLPALDRALALLYLDDRPQAEIAEVLGLTPTHVATKLGRLKQRLRDQVAALR